MYNQNTFFLKFQKFLQNYMRGSIAHLFIYTYTLLMLLLPRMHEKLRPVSTLMQGSNRPRSQYYVDGSWSLL